MSGIYVVQKYASETVDVPVTFAALLGVGEAIASATASVIGTGTITVGATPTVASPIVTCVVTAGTDGVTDSFRVLATTSLGQVFEAVIYVAVGVEVPAPVAGVLYATADDLLGGLSADFIAQLSMDGGSTADPALVQKAIRDASRWIDGYLGRYAPPIVIGTNGTQVTLDTLQVHCVIVVKAWLFGRKTAGDAFKQPDEGFQATRKYFEGIQGGKALPGATEPAVSTTTTFPYVTGSVMGGEIVFDDESAVF
jgi:phage gp36-like protein